MLILRPWNRPWETINNDKIRVVFPRDIATFNFLLPGLLWMRVIERCCNTQFLPFRKQWRSQSTTMEIQILIIEFRGNCETTTLIKEWLRILFVQIVDWLVKFQLLDSFGKDLILMQFGRNVRRSYWFVGWLTPQDLRQALLEIHPRQHQCSLYNLSQHQDNTSSSVHPKTP